METRLHFPAPEITICLGKPNCVVLTENGIPRYRNVKVRFSCENEIICMSRTWDKEIKNLSSRRIRTYDLPNTGRAIYLLGLRITQGKRGHILGSYLTRVLHTARISNVGLVLCGERMKDGQFKARWNECENEIISVSRAWDKAEKIWVPDRILSWCWFLEESARVPF